MSDQNSSSMLADIYREVGETKVNVENLSKKVDSHIEISTSEFKRINELDHEQNRILDKHIEGVNTLKDMHVAHRIETITQIDLLKQSLEIQKKECDARIATMERPFTWARTTGMYFGKVAVWIGGIATAIAAILSLLGVM